MSTASSSLAPPRPAAPREIRIVSHSTLFYWWPVWAIGFLLGIISMFDSTLAVVPSGSRAVLNIEVPGAEGARDVLVLPKNAKWRQINSDGQPVDPYLHVSRSKSLGVIFCAVLLLVIVITNVPLRGLWSVIVIVFVLSLTIIFAVLGWWETIFDWASVLDVRITAGGYFLISTILFAFWLVVILFFDPQIYMVFTPGQLRVRLEIGDAETAYDTTGMTIQKQRSDLFRHWILGLGSGDLIVNTAGAQSHHFDMANVLFLGRKVREIEEMLRSRQVVAGQPG